MIALVGGDVVLPDRVVADGTVLIDRGRISAIEPRRAVPSGADTIEVTGCYVVPGFIDVHVHGVEGQDALDGAGAVASIAARLVRYGVTAFCPTSVACGPDDLRTFLDQVRQARVATAARSARPTPQSPGCAL